MYAVSKRLRTSMCTLLARVGKRILYWLAASSTPVNWPLILVDSSVQEERQSKHPNLSYSPSTRSPMKKPQEIPVTAEEHQRISFVACIASWWHATREPVCVSIHLHYRNFQPITTKPCAVYRGRVVELGQEVTRVLAKNSAKWLIARRAQDVKQRRSRETQPRLTI